MVIHCMQVQCDGALYDPWFIDEDTSNILILHEAIKDDLKTSGTHKFTTFDVNAIIRKGEVVICIVNDASLMEVFRANTNDADLILLDVVLIWAPPLAVLDRFEKGDPSHISGDGYTVVDDLPYEDLEDAGEEVEEDVEQALGDQGIAKEQEVEGTGDSAEKEVEDCQRAEKEVNGNEEAGKEFEQEFEGSEQADKEVGEEVEGSGAAEKEGEGIDDAEIKVARGVEDSVEGSEEVEGNVESEEHDVDDSVSDPNWNDKIHNNNDDGSSKYLSDFVIDSDTISWSEDDQPRNDQVRPDLRDEEIDPNGNIPEAPSHLRGDGMIQLQLWQVFEDHKQFSDVLLDYCIQEEFELRRVKLDPLRVSAVCKAEGCPWRIHASRSPDGMAFIIKTYNDEHRCQLLNAANHASNWDIIQEHVLLSPLVRPLKQLVNEVVPLLCHDVDVAAHVGFPTRRHVMIRSTLVSRPSPQLNRLMNESHVTIFCN